MPSWEITTLPTDGEGDIISGEYKWEYEKKQFTWETKISEDLYKLHKRRQRIYDYGSYVADHFTQRFFADLANEIQSVASNNRYNYEEVVELAARFVQSLTYTRDSVSTGYSNYPRYPIETLIDETGDCEDTSILLAAILHSLDYRVRLLEFESHLGLCVELENMPVNFEINGFEYSYIETTDAGWDVGELPPRLSGQSTTVHQINDSPSLYTSWAGETNGDRLSCGGVILNAGKGTASQVLLQILLKDQDGQTIAVTEQQWESVPSDAEYEWKDEVVIRGSNPVTAEWRLGIEQVLHDHGQYEL